MDCSAIVLNKILTDKSLDIWAKLKLAFIDPAYSSVYSAISRHYEKYSCIPSFEELEMNMREGVGKSTLAALKLIDTEEISTDVALDALIDQYTQNQTIGLLDKFIDKLPIYDTQEIKEELNSIVLELDEKTHTTEGVFFMSDILLFKDAETLSRDRVYLGLNNTFDAVLNGVARQELILIGGKRGSGKSITASNIVVNQYESGNSCVIFTIEMIAHEVLERNLSILSDVSHVGLKQDKLLQNDLLKVVRARAGMFEDSDDVVLEYLRHRDKFKFEADLIRNKKLKRDNQMVIIDDRALTITSIDLHLGKLKAKFGDKLTVCVVDYLNQIVPEHGKSQYDWQPQIDISKGLKNLARKYDIVMVSPYQVDSAGEARFAKGILDAPDIAVLMEAHEKETNTISFATTKIRGGPELSFSSAINWDTLRISPVPVDKPTSKDNVAKVKTKKVDEKAVDVPWN